LFCRDFLFVAGDYLTIIRVELETLTPGIDVHVDVISIWAHILNVEEKKKARESTYRMFCNAQMIVSQLLKKHNNTIIIL